MLITAVFNAARNNKYTILETFYEEHIKAARQLGSLYISNTQNEPKLLPDPFRSNRRS